MAFQDKPDAEDKVLVFLMSEAGCVIKYGKTDVNNLKLILETLGVMLPEERKT